MSTPDSDVRIIRTARCAVFVQWQGTTAVSEQDALLILQRSFKLTGQRQYVVLVDMRLVPDVSPEARRVFCSARNILAAAMLGSKPMDRVLSAAYEHALYPSEYFTDETTAGQWLGLMHDLLCKDPVEHTMSLTIDLDPFATRRRRNGLPTAH